MREDAWQVLQAWQRRLPNAVFTGLTAAWLHRLDVDLPTQSKSRFQGVQVFGRA